MKILFRRLSFFLTFAFSSLIFFNRRNQFGPFISTEKKCWTPTTSKLPSDDSFLLIINIFWWFWLLWKKIARATLLFLRLQFFLLLNFFLDWRWRKRKSLLWPEFLFSPSSTILPFSKEIQFFVLLISGYFYCHLSFLPFYSQLLSTQKNEEEEKGCS